jgi:putative N6-adenine-specific DNA methylase
MDYAYATTSRYLAQLPEELKDLASEELLSLGCTDPVPVYRGVYFTADKAALYRANFQSRLINRILAPLVSFKCPSEQALHRRATDIPWEEFLATGQTFAVFTAVSGSRISHSQYAGLKVKDAVVDRFRRRTGSRPSVDTREPDLWIHLHLHDDKATISVDASGGSLHRRGYRIRSVQAPMIETLAAAVVSLSGWDGSGPLYDPMCGSGTLLCEAFLLATKTPAGFLRGRFGFESFPDFDRPLWERVRAEGMENVRPVERGVIAGSDIDAVAVAAARANCGRMDPHGRVAIRQADMFELEGIEGATIVCNPPYGVRLGHGEDMADFFRRFGDFLKRRCRGSVAYLFFGDPAHLKHIGLRASKRIPLSTGGLDGRLARFELY